MNDRDEPRCNPARAAIALPVLEAAVADPDWAKVLQAFARCKRIIRGQEIDGTVNPDLLQHPEEHSLWAALERESPSVRSMADLLAALRRLVDPITAFFDKILVMDEDPGLRRNRLALVGRVARLAEGIATLDYLEGF